jgi:PIN domain nuclease of toxin-antitoxin system
VRLLLDTHTLIWALGAARSLPGSIRRLIEDGRNEVYFSSISIFEIASKRASGSKSAPSISAETVTRLADKAGLREVSVQAAHAMAVETLAPFHGDSFDRLLLAQAQIEGLQLVTHDEALAQYDSRTILF